MPDTITVGDWLAGSSLEDLVPRVALDLVSADEQRAFPRIAKDQALAALMQGQARLVPTTHALYCGDSRAMEIVDDASVHLVVTSPPYWTLKEYLPNERQLGAIADYEGFLDELDRVWAHAFRALVPGGRLVVVVGDVCLSRRQHGKHVVYPLHASIQEHCRRIGFDNLATIIWHKITNAKLETPGNGASFLGKPYEPNAVLKNDIEYILSLRKPGGYRSPSVAARALSLIPESVHGQWFRQVWSIGGASTRSHPAPFPVALAERLVRMFSFVGDTVLDPFLGTGTTSVAAATWGRSSIGFEVEPAYYEQALRRLRELAEGAAQPVRGKRRS